MKAYTLHEETKIIDLGSATPTPVANLGYAAATKVRAQKNSSVVKSRHEVAKVSINSDSNNIKIKSQRGTTRIRTQDSPPKILVRN